MNLSTFSKICFYVKFLVDTSDTPLVVTNEESHQKNTFGTFIGVILSNVSIKQQIWQIYGTNFAKSVFTSHKS